MVWGYMFEAGHNRHFPQRMEECTSIDTSSNPIFFSCKIREVTYLHKEIRGIHIRAHPVKKDILPVEHPEQN